MTSHNKRQSERVIPRGSDEDTVVIECGERRFHSKMLDLSDGGMLVYVLSDAIDALTTGADCELSLYSEGQRFAIQATISRTHGRLLAFQFLPLDAEALRHLQARLVRMEAEWKRLMARA